MIKHTGAVVLAAGSGSRMQSKIKKQYLEIEGKPLIYYALQAFEQSSVEQVVLVAAPGDEDYCRREIVETYQFHKVKKIIGGGKERYHSVFYGLQQLDLCDYVLIHDGARPFVTPYMIERALDGARTYQACVVGMPVKDTIKISDSNGYAEYTPNRKSVWMIQTPQAFSFPLIREAYEKLLQQTEVSVTDDAMAVETFMNKKVKLIPGSYYNIKITTPEDLKTAEVFLKDQSYKEF
ncbi:MAG: 2-C-methyl-D-erythritol 4-phosphate cytidylyltransferase [Lachnospiraceae bacterium]|nr:2-C-methyl-D-erythritol 4-phosphate cytidylyltransferase [Lachnospiraceae bacterium]